MRCLRALPALLRAMDLIRRATGVALAAHKTAILSAWTTDLAQAKSDLVAAASAAEHMEVVSQVRHLGAMLGWTSHRARWEALVPIYVDRAAGIRQAKGSFVECARMYCTLAFSVLRFIASFDRPPVDVVQV